MPHDTLLCLDIESVPDRDLIPADWPADRFPKPIWHRVVAMSFVEARIEGGGPGGRERYRVEWCRTGGEAGWDERRILQSFWSFFSRRQARVVTWNGRGFNLPVLRLRALMHGIAADAWDTRGDKWTGYTKRFSADWHCDLMEQLADYGACMKLGLEDVAQAIGLPGKVGGHGSEVEGMVERGEVDQVRAYCEADCLNLFGLYVRWGLLTGRLDYAGHDEAMASLADHLEGNRVERPHLGEFLDRWRASTRPAPCSCAPPSLEREGWPTPTGPRCIACAMSARVDGAPRP